MSYEIAEYSDQTKANFIDSVSISWLSELVDSTTLSNFCSEHSLPDQGRSLFEEVDYENLSGVSNPNLTTAQDAYHFVNSIVELYKSSRFNYKRVYIKETNESLTDLRVFIDNKLVHFVDRFFANFSIEDFFKLKGINAPTDNLMVNLVNDTYDEGEHKPIPGKQVELILKDENLFDQLESRITKTLDFLKNSEERGSMVQLMSA